MKWYQLSKKEILNQLTTTDAGLLENERKRRLEIDGYNKIEEKQDLKPWQKFLKHFTDLLMIVLMFAAVLKLFTGDFIESAIIFLVVVINGLVSYWQERKAEDSLDGLRQMMGQEAVILSDGVKATIPSENVVVGDVIALKAGDIVPADLRLIEVHDLVIEESILTGESEPVEKQIETIAEKSAIGDQTNMAFSGTLVQSGSAYGVVVAAGSDTEIGKINQALQSVHKQTTPLVKKMHQLNKHLFKGIMVLIVFLVFFTTFRFGMDLNLLFSAMIALIVAMVPEGLPAVLTMILSVGVKEMADEQAIIKSMPSVETLGSMTVICSDKTGTLTKNEMTVVDVESKVNRDGVQLIDIMNNCQELKLDDKQSIDELKGNPTELALLHYVEDENLNLKQVKAKIPFNSSYKYMATRHPQGDKDIIYVKGAPEVLMSQASLSKEQIANWHEKASNLAQKGQRVLGFGYKIVEANDFLNHEELTGIQFAGIAGIIDPPKESAIQAVKECQKAGISVKMITGDHKETAKAIGEQIGLKHTSKVLEGLQLDTMSDDELREEVKHVDIFARTTPEHKLRIVTALQDNEEIVGMTGDGVNDAPALKKADIGIAMGIKGSEVSKQAADMVLADDNFHTIAKAVKEGRRIFDNLKKTINFFIPTALAQGLVVIFALLMNRPLPLTPVQILWVNMVTTITLSYALGFEKASADTMNRPPSPTNQGILTKYSLFRILYVSLLIMVPSYFLASQYDGIMVQQTILLQSIVFAQAVYMINCRELVNPSLNKAMFENRSLFVSIGALILLQLSLQFLPLAHSLIGTTALSASQLSAMLLNALIIFVIIEIEKFVTKKYLKAKEAKNSKELLS